MFKQSDDPDDGRGIDGLAVRFVVKAHVAAGDRRIEGAAGFADAFDGLAELPHDRRSLGIPKIQAVGRRQGLRTRARDIARRFGDGEHRPSLRIERAVPAVAVDRHRQRAIGVLDPHDAGAHARHVDGVGADHVVVLAINPQLAADSGRSDQCE